MSEKLKIAGVQMNPTLMDKTGNLKKILQYTEVASAQGAGLIVFPECALTGYCFDSSQEAIPFAEPVPGPSTLEIAALCQKLQLYVITGLLEKEGERFFNAAVLIGPGRIVGKYRKIHLPFLGVDQFVNPGDLGFKVHETPIGRIGLNICYDCSFPESARVMALKGADVVALPTNWPPGAEETAEYVINARGLENHVYYVAVNRVGKERDFRFIGRSRIVDVHGKTLAQASVDEEEVIYAEIEPAQARNKHIVRVPGKHEIDRFKDRRPEYYEGISGRA
jgi:predicted amidohydrolase